MAKDKLKDAYIKEETNSEPSEDNIKETISNDETGLFKVAAFNTVVMGLSPLNYELTNDMAEEDRRQIVKSWYQRLADYLNTTFRFHVKIGNESMYAFLGLTRAEVDAMIAGARPYTFEHHKFASKAKSICAVARESYMADGKINAVAGIFLSKIHDGYVEETRVVNVTQNELDKPQTMDELAMKYLSHTPEPIKEGDENGE